MQQSCLTPLQVLQLREGFAPSHFHIFGVGMNCQKAYTDVGTALCDQLLSV
jgi:hypothetical protein